MVARTLKADAFENKFLCKFNLDPGSLVVLDMPLVPFFLARAQQILGVITDRMVFSCHTCACVQMVSLKRSSYRHSGCLDHRLLNNWLWLLDKNLGLLHWILCYNLRLNYRLHIDFTKMEEYDFS